MTRPLPKWAAATAKAVKPPNWFVQIMKRILSALLFLTLAYSTAVAAPASSYHAKLDWPQIGNRKPDADTFDAVRESGHIHAEKIRPWLGDAPERSHSQYEIDQPFGPEALAYAVKHWQGREVVILPRGTVTYGRPVCKIEDAIDGEDFVQDLVKHGFMWIDSKYKPTRNDTQAYRDYYQTLLTDLAKAKADKVGLWADKNPIEPKEWRKQLRAQNNQPALQRLLGR
jgi:endonuclease YncB( thermonuclease family)